MLIPDISPLLNAFFYWILPLMKRIFFVCCFVFFTFSSFAQSSREQVGGVSFESEKEISPYKTYQDESIEFASSIALSAEKGVTSKPKNLSDGAINYLTGAYLFCSTNRGACREIPQTLFEADVINSILEKSVSCNYSQRFWRKWLENNMEERSKFLVKTAHLGIADDFRKNIRPAFIQCEKTVSEILKNQTDSSIEALKKRYAENTIERNSVIATPTILETLKASVPDVFAATGSQNKKEEEKDPTSGKKSTMIKR